MAYNQVVDDKFSGRNSGGILEAGSLHKLGNIIDCDDLFTTFGCVIRALKVNTPEG